MGGCERATVCGTGEGRLPVVGDFEGSKVGDSKRVTVGPAEG